LSLVLFDHFCSSPVFPHAHIYLCTSCLLLKLAWAQ
jgi:hypothetical protein